MSPPELYRRARDLGLHLEPAGDKLAVFPKGKCPPDFADVLRAHKPELLCWLEGRSASLREDEIPWLHVARQVLDGEFEHADQTTIESLTIGLRSIQHLECQRALERLAIQAQARRKPNQ